MKKIFLFVFIFFMFQSCVYADTAMSRVMDSWIGENIDTVIDHWGYPSCEKEIAGKKLYYWLNSSYMVTGNLGYGIYGNESTCNRILEVDKKNIVIKWQYEGNSCPNFYFTSKSWVNPNNDPWQKEKAQRKLLKHEKKD